METYYVQMSLSPDDRFLLSGSSDANAYIWQVDDPSADPVTLRGIYMLRPIHEIAYIHDKANLYKLQLLQI